MKSYSVSKEFRLIRHFTPPLTTPILPVCNLFLEGMALGVRLDKAVTVTRFALPTDEGAQLAQQMTAAGVPVTLRQTKGTVHGYDILLHIPTTRESVAARLSFMQSRFKKR